MRKSWLVYYVIIVFKPKILFFLLNEMENFNQIIKNNTLNLFLKRFMQIVLSTLDSLFQDFGCRGRKILNLFLSCAPLLLDVEPDIHAS